jgi:hypothetical protein
MSVWLIWACTAAYAWTAGEQLLKENVGHALMFGAYAVANIGIIMTLKG